MRRAREVALAILLVVLSFASLGCRAPSGVNDEQLAFARAAGGPLAPEIRVLAMRRLSAARVPSDVEIDDAGRLLVTLDGDLSTRAEEALVWPGGIALHAARPDGGARGSRDVALSAPGDGLALAQAEPQGDDEPTYVSRRADETPLGTLAAGLSVSFGEGPTLSLRVAPGSPAAAALARARAEARGAPVYLVVGRTVLGTIDDLPTLRFGAGLRAYARAEGMRAMLTSPALPPLRRVERAPLPPNVGLATACLVLPIALSIAWLAFVRRFDRAHPEPVWLVLVTFALGGVGAGVALAVELGLARLSPYLHPGLVTMGGRGEAFPLAWLVLTVVVGFVEEGSKLLGAVFATRRKEFDEPIDGVLYAIASSLGFAAIENIRYFAIGRLTPPLVVARSFMSVPAHMFFGALWGFALGQRLVDRRARVAPWLVGAAAAHGLFDALLATRGAAWLAIPLNVALAGLFVVLVRRALRYGVVTEQARAAGASGREHFRLGRPALFAASAASVIALAFALFWVGAAYQVSHYRPGGLFVASSAALLALLSLAALGVSATLPLDVVLDAHGVTFAGAARAWESIRGVRREGSRVVLVSEAGDVDLGPGGPRALDEITARIEARLGGARASPDEPP